MCEQTPLISVIVPVYNILEYLPRCVRTIREQTFGNLEILLVDDGSTDGTGQLCEDLAVQDERIRVFHKPNGGSSSARNLGISQAKGEYLGFVDSDDYIEPDMYERLWKAAVENQAPIVQVGRNEVDEKGNILPDICIPPASEEHISNMDFMKELLMHRGDCSFCTKLVHRDCLKELRFPEGVLNEDFHLLIKLLIRCPQVISLPGYGYHVFYRIGSNTRKKSSQEFSRVYADNVENADMAREIVREHYPQLSQIALRFGVFQRLDYLLHIPTSQMKKENTQYRVIVHWLRKNWHTAMKNPYLTGKNKGYHTLFAVAPKGIRLMHKMLKSLGGRECINK